ncbi:hypothetical protein HMPREF1579_01124 [Gardnerella vaginalis JCP8066]|nr:hypothetical protein HMPREF1579_01124 [Gardnerella vaginalis JCP8066]
MINRKRNALTILRPQSRRCGLFLHPKARSLCAFLRSDLPERLKRSAVSYLLLREV